MAEQKSNLHILDWLDDYDIDELFNMQGVPKAERDFWRLRAEGAKKVKRLLIEMFEAGQTSTKKFSDLSKEFVAIYNTDPTVYLPHRLWAKEGQVADWEEAHHRLPVARSRKGLLNLTTKVGEGLNAAQREVHKILADLNHGLANHPKNLISVGRIAHIGSKAFKEGPGSSAASAHPGETKILKPATFDSVLPERRGPEIIRKLYSDLKAGEMAVQTDLPRRTFVNQALADILGTEPRDFYSKPPTAQERVLLNLAQNKRLLKAINRDLPAFQFHEQLKQTDFNYNPDELILGGDYERIADLNDRITGGFDYNLGLGTDASMKLWNSIKTNWKGELFGAVADPEVHRKLSEGDYEGAAVEAGKGAVIGNLIQQGIRQSPKAINQLNLLGGWSVPTNIIQKGAPVVAKASAPLIVQSIADIYLKKATGKTTTEHVVDLDEKTDSPVGTQGYMSSLAGGSGPGTVYAAHAFTDALKSLIGLESKKEKDPDIEAAFNREESLFSTNLYENTLGIKF